MTHRRSPTVPPQVAEVRVYSRLFASPNPESNPGGLLADALPTSLVTYKGAMVDNSVKGAAVTTVFQFVRSGYVRQLSLPLSSSPIHFVGFG